jgi:hypothetical protein
MSIANIEVEFQKFHGQILPHVEAVVAESIIVPVKWNAVEKPPDWTRWIHPTTSWKTFHTLIISIPKNSSFILEEISGLGLNGKDIVVLFGYGQTDTIGGQNPLLQEEELKPISLPNTLTWPALTNRLLEAKSSPKRGRFRSLVISLEVKLYLYPGIRLQDTFHVPNKSFPELEIMSVLAEKRFWMLASLLLFISHALECKQEKSTEDVGETVRVALGNAEGALEGIAEGDRLVGLAVAPKWRALA